MSVCFGVNTFLTLKMISVEHSQLTLKYSCCAIKNNTLQVIDGNFIVSYKTFSQKKKNDITVAFYL